MTQRSTVSPRTTSTSPAVTPGQPDIKPRSREVTDGLEKAAARGMLRAVGMGDDDWVKPQIGVASSWNEITPCNLSLDRLAKAVKDARFDERIYNAGAASLIDLLREVPDSVNTVLLIGHAPGIPVLATALAQDGAGSTDAAERLSQGFPTCGLAVLGFEGRWAALAPEAAWLQEFVVPRG